MPKKKECMICGETGCTQNCHIVPKYIFEWLKPAFIKKLDKINIINLCPNHHYLFDNYKLTDAEVQVLVNNNVDLRAQKVINQLLDVKEDNIRIRKNAFHENLRESPVNATHVKLSEWFNKFNEIW